MNIRIVKSGKFWNFSFFSTSCAELGICHSKWAFCGTVNACMKVIFSKTEAKCFSFMARGLHSLRIMQPKSVFTIVAVLKI